jgi:hypothetical protein
LPKRRLRIWAPEGYAGLDFVHRRLSLVQPSEQMRRHGLRVDQLDPARRTKLAEEVFGRHLEMCDRTCTAPADQLTRELQHFVQCVRTGSTPRVTGEDGRAALALACRVLESVRSHPWEGRPDGATGPAKMPPPRGRLFRPEEGRAAA